MPSSDKCHHRVDIGARQLDAVAVDANRVMLAYRPTLDATRAVLLALIPIDDDPQALAQRICQSV